jgi:Flp pilus assembly protein TadG
LWVEVDARMLHLGVDTQIQQEQAHPSMSSHRRRRTRGQSLVEFALILPILAGFVGATVDLSRLYEQKVKLEAATRDAAEYVASDTTVTSSSLALTKAKAVICAQFGLASTCTSPSVTINSYSRSTSDPGTAEFPQVTVSISTSLPFSTLVPWPFVSTQWRTPYSNGGGASSTPTAYATTLNASYSFTVLQGR